MAASQVSQETYESEINMTAQNINSDVCGTCKKGQGKRAAKWIQCTKCSVWYHISCAGVITRQYNQMDDSTE